MDIMLMYEAEQAHKPAADHLQWQPRRTLVSRLLTALQAVGR